MIRQNLIVKFLQQLRTLILRQLVDALRKPADGVYTLPARDGVRPHDGMHSSQVRSHVLRRPARFLVHNSPPVLYGTDESIADERRGQPVEEVLVSLAVAIVQVVSRRPERVAPRAGQLRQPQAGVVRRAGLELDVAVPGCRVVAALGLVGVAEELLALHGRDGADLVVADAELRCVVEDGVDVDGGGCWSAGEFAQAKDELLLELVREAVLFAEEDYAALAD